LILPDVGLVIVSALFYQRMLYIAREQGLIDLETSY
jgi:hypothetical protein